MNTSEKLLKLK